MKSTVKGPSIAEPETWETGWSTAPTQKEGCGPQDPGEFMDPTNVESLKFAIRSYETENPASRAGLLFAQINAVATSRRMNSITMQAIEHDAHALIPADPSGAHGALGALAALRGRVEEVHAHFRIALDTAGRSATTYLNFSIALLQVGDCRKAYEMALEADGRTGGGSSVLPHLIMTAFESGGFRETLEHCERRRSFDPQTPLAHCGLAQTFVDAIERGNLSEPAAAHALITANRVRGAAGVRPAATSLYQDMRKPGEFRYRVDVHATRRHAQDLSASVASRIAREQEPSDSAQNTLQVIFVANQ